MYCGIHVYEKLDGMLAWLLEFIALRELLLCLHALGGLESISTLILRQGAYLHLAITMLYSELSKRVSLQSA